MANTTWSTTDKTANLVLSGGNLIATAGAGGGGVRTSDKQISGKFYWEITNTVTAAASTGCGLYSPTAAFAAFSAAGPGSCGYVHGGTVYVDSVSMGTNLLGTISNGTVVCFAFDADARLIWMRSGAAGNWNGSASANPATGVGGFLTGLGRGIPAYPAFFGAASAEAVTANFGDTAFAGTVPSGFTSGFTAGVTSPTNTLATQSAVEHWLATNPDAQITQVALEHWASTTSTGLQAVVTQVALEHWASVANVSTAVPAQARVMILA